MMSDGCRTVAPHLTALTKMPREFIQRDTSILRLQRSENRAQRRHRVPFAQKFLEEPQPVTPCFAAVRAEGVSTVIEGRSLRGSGAEPSTRCAGLGIWLRGSTEAGTKISA